MAWPARTRICLECRTLCTTTCPAGHRRVVDLRTSREQLVDAVWGPKAHRPALLAAAPVVKSNSSWSGWDIFGIFELDWFGLILIAGALFWFLGASIVKLFRKRAALATAQGAVRRGLPLLRTGQTGYVLGADEAVAFGCELRHADTVMLRDGATSGFDVRLDSGELVRVPAGLCAFDMTNAPAMRDVESYLASIDPWRRDPDPFHHDDARRVTLGAGDRVELLCELEPCAGGSAGYREAATASFVPRGFVRLRRA
jgi:hypothetical protein